MANKKKNETKLRTLFLSDETVKSFAQSLIGRGLIDRSSISAEKVKQEKAEFIDFLASAFSSVDSEKEAAISPATNFLQQCINKEHINKFTTNLVKFATTCKTAAEYGGDPILSVHSEILCLVLSAVGVTVVATAPETPVFTPEWDRLRTEIQDLFDEVRAALSEPPEIWDKLKSHWIRANVEARADNYPEANKIAGKVKTALLNLLKGPSSEDAPGKTPGLVDQLTEQAKGLVDCQFVATDGFTVSKIIEDSESWNDITRELVPATVMDSAAVLESLPPGGKCWCWLTGSSTHTPFLYLVPMIKDPGGASFQAELPRLYKRFKNSFEDAISGILARSKTNKLLLSSKDANAQQISDRINVLQEHYGVEFPAFQELMDAIMR